LGRFGADLKRLPASNGLALMKIGTIHSPWRYGAAARPALQSVNLRQLAILRYASRQWAGASALDWPHDRIDPETISWRKK
jgi:hypothetical protein